MAYRANAIAQGNQPINGKIQITYDVTVVDTVNPAFGLKMSTSILVTGDEQESQNQTAAIAQIRADALSPGNGSITLASNEIKFS